MAPYEKTPFVLRTPPVKGLYEYSWTDGDCERSIQLYAISPDEARLIIESLAAHIHSDEKQK